ncbi:CDA_G0054330.mRNA.1.CDS.1 [Saccharomyces cerevisiae]|nr:CDA_G0054330.mRNA.1.CDS.1 [Saccharomyces cerevisiae]CAI7478585.1 CDA_G0054330.mRNA.1.CDS.1 [Saccharomyces cerevisiae]
MTLAELLGRSRIAQVANNHKPLTYTGKKFHPTHQIIETKPSTLYRQEWGLKSAIPSKIKSRYLVYNDLDTLERITTFEPRGGTQWNRLRFQEMGVPIVSNIGRQNPFFKDISRPEDESHAKLSLFKEMKGGTDISPAAMEKRLKKITALIRSFQDEFKEWLVENHPDELKLNSNKLEDYVVKFLNKKLETKTNKKFNTEIIGTGGLSYSLPGKLKNSPNGVIQRTVVPGRVLNVVKENNDNKWLAAIGGFVADVVFFQSPPSSFNSMGDFIRMKTFLFEILEASMEKNGSVSMHARLLEPQNDKTREFFDKRPIYKPLTSRRARRPSVGNIQEANNLLNIIKGN